MKYWLTLIVCLLLNSLAWGVGEDANANIDQGKSLFASEKLGTNGKSCATCHPGGRKLEWPATFPEDKLTELTNTCITKALKGKPLPADSDEMKSLVRYIKTFAGP